MFDATGCDEDRTRLVATAIRQPVYGNNITFSCHERNVEFLLVCFYDLIYIYQCNIFHKEYI